MTLSTYRVRATLDGVVEEFPLELTRHHRIVVHRPVVRQPKYAPLRARPGSGLLVPAPWTAAIHPISFLLAAVHVARGLPDVIVLLVGHTAPDEHSALGRARAQSMRCVLTDDADAWTRIATDHGSIADVKAYFHHLSTVLGWQCRVDAIDASTGPATTRAILAFQIEYNAEFGADILEDGICGTETLDAVFRTLRFEWQRWLHKHDLTQSDVDCMDIRAIDASTTDRSLPGMASLDGEPGLDILIVERPALGGGEPTAASVYGSRIARFEEFEIPPEPWAWQCGPYTIVTDLFADEVIAAERYTLRSTDGAYEATRSLPADAVDTGVLELRFSAVPCDKSYGLSVVVHDGRPQVLFSDVPYNKLHTLATTGWPPAAPADGTDGGDTS